MTFFYHCAENAVFYLLLQSTTDIPVTSPNAKMEIQNEIEL